jgi:outer membrane lipoprotein-sorting protein
MNNKFFIILIIFFLLKTVAYSADTEFERFIQDYSSVKCIKGNIIQYIHTNVSVEKLSGDYIAVSEGWFRIDYTEPEKQIVINNNKGLFWFYPDKNLLFFKKRELLAESVLPVNPLLNDFTRLKIVYQGIRFYSLLKYAHVYSFKMQSGNNSVKIWFDSGRRFIVRKYIIDNSGREIMKEIYHKHFIADGVYIPSQIELFVRSMNGLIHTRTEYGNLSINTFPDQRMFEFDIKKNMTVREFNEVQ